MVKGLLPQVGSRALQLRRQRVEVLCQRLLCRKVRIGISAICSGGSLSKVSKRNKMVGTRKRSARRSGSVLQVVGR